MADTNAFRVRLVTPDRTFIDGTATSVTLPGRSGYMQVLYGHAPLLTELGTGDLTLEGGDTGDRRFFVVWGFAEVLPNRVTILVESVIPPGEIDIADVRRQLERGRRMWKEAGDDSVRYEEANQIIREAEQRLAAAEGAGKTV